MARVLLPACLSSVAAAAILWVRAVGGPDAMPVAASPDARSTPSDVGAAAPPQRPPFQDPELLSAWFEAAVLRELERSEASDDESAHLRDGTASPIERKRAAGAQETPASVVTPVGRAPRRILNETSDALRDAGASEPERLRERANWEYLEDVFQGRVSGIPNERKAGISLQEMDRLGDIPHVEALRREGRIEELHRLGLGPEVARRSALNPRLSKFLEEEGRLPPP